MHASRGHMSECTVANTLQHHIAMLCVQVGLARTLYTPYMTVDVVISLPKIPYVHRIYMVLANPVYTPWAAPSSWAGRSRCVHQV